MAADFPPLRTLETPTNLPAQATSFVGREREAAEARRLLVSTRLLTLTGPGGTGKTRLSIKVAGEVLDRFRDGVFLTELAPITDPELVVPTIAGTLGVREEPDRPAIETLKEYLRERQLLLVLDNFEQVVDAAPAIRELLAAAPRVSMLVTSREVLHLAGEQEFPVPPLALPDPAHLPPLASLSAFDAVALFIQRARAVRPDFAVTNANAPAVAEICARLDGLPLAIELAAARVKLLPPDAILARLERRLAFLTSAARDLPVRQQTLRGAIDWSHDLLDEVERTLFRRLAVFVGGCDFEAAEAVCNPAGELGIDTLDGLGSLLDKSLIRQEETEHGEPRFRMLETIREYGLERLADADDAAEIRRRHATFFLTLAEEAEADLTSTRGPVWMDRLEHEHDNIRAVLRWSQTAGSLEIALRIGGALWRFWHQHAHLREGRAWMEELLAHPAAAGRTLSRAKGLSGLGGLAYWQADFAAARVAYEESLSIQREMGGPAGIADALYNLGFALSVSGQADAARPMFEECLARFLELGDELRITRAREALVFASYQSGDHATARRLQEENLAAVRRMGDPFWLANTLSLLSVFATADGDFDEARRELTEAIELFGGPGDLSGIVNVLMLFAHVSLAEGVPERAAHLVGAADAIRQEIGSVATPIELLRLPDPAEVARERLGDHAYAVALTAGRSMSRKEAVAYATATATAASDTPA